MRQKSHKREVNAYVRGVVSGRIVAGELVRAACQRHLDDLQFASQQGLCFDEKLANRAINFFPLLKHSTAEYAGQPFELMPFQKFIVWSLFGWRRASDGRRRFRRALVSLAKGNGKSPLAAAIMLMLFAFDTPVEVRAECFCFNTEQEQARIVFDEICRYREQSEELQRHIEQYKSSLFVASNNSLLVPMSKMPKDGRIPHAMVVDELHDWREEHREMWDKITVSLGKRRQPLLLVITTAGSDQSKIWRELDNLATLVVERGNNIEADDLFVFIARIDEDDDPLDEAVWPKANPLLESGVVKIDGLRSLARDAKVDPLAKQKLIRYHCNREVRGAAKVITAKMWASGDQPLPALDDLVARAGLDWGWKDDLCALGYAFELEPTEIKGQEQRRLAVAVDVWVPEGGARDLWAEPWASWINDGWLRVTPGKITDTEAIYARLKEQQQRFGIASIALDPNNCREFGSRVQTDHGIEAFWFGQTCGKYNEPTRELLCMLHEGRLVHGGNPILAWAAQNMVLREDHRGYVMPAKDTSAEKIDPIVAVIMAISEVLYAERNPPGTGKVWAV